MVIIISSIIPMVIVHVSFIGFPSGHVFVAQRAGVQLAIRKVLALQVTPDIVLGFVGKQVAQAAHVDAPAQLVHRHRDELVQVPPFGWE